jgi:hypothetical protein
MIDYKFSSIVLQVLLNIIIEQERRYLVQTCSYLNKQTTYFKVLRSWLEIAIFRSLNLVEFWEGSSGNWATNDFLVLIKDEHSHCRKSWQEKWTYEFPHHHFSISRYMFFFSLFHSAIKWILLFLVCR